MFVMVLLVGTISAGILDVKVEYKNTNDYTLNEKIIPYNIIWEEYPPLKVDSFLTLGKTIFSGAIVEHTKICGNNCLSQMEIYIADDSPLVDSIIFKTLQEDGKWIKQNIRNYKFEYLGNVEDYDWVFSKIKNETEHIKVGEHEGWIKYNEGEILPAGEYTLKLTGEKKPSRTVDWIIDTNGKTLNSWATWGNISEGDDAEVILNSPLDNVVTYTAVNTFNATANVTGGAELTNMSLWDNSTGSWELQNISFAEIGTIHNPTTTTNEDNAFDFDDDTYALKDWGSYTSDPGKGTSYFGKIFDSRYVEIIKIKASAIITGSGFWWFMWSFNYIRNL